MLIDLKFTYCAFNENQQLLYYFGFMISELMNIGKA